MRYLIRYFLFIFIIIPNFCFGEGHHNIDPNDSAAQWEYITNQIKGHVGEVQELQPTHFTAYGRVLDQYGAPIPDAKVEVSWMSDRLVNFVQMVDEVTLTTDAEGNFSFEAVKERFPGINEIIKSGYEYDPSLNTFPSLRRDEKLDALVNSTEQEPVSIYLRKMGERTYLYHDEELSWAFQEPYSFVNYNIYRRGLYDIDPDINKLSKPDKIDLVFDVQHNINDGQYIFKVIAPLDTNGVKLGDDKFYTAPVEGYSPEIAITINHDEKIEKYLYFTSRKLSYEVDGVTQYKSIYSRMKITLRAFENRLMFYYDTWTNPYGSLNLEYEPDMPFELEAKLDRETKKFIQSGKLPPEPNLQEMMASGQYN